MHTVKQTFNPKCWFNLHLRSENNEMTKSVVFDPCINILNGSTGNQSPNPHPIYFKYFCLKKNEINCHLKESTEFLVHFSKTNHQNIDRRIWI